MSISKTYFKNGALISALALSLITGAADARGPGGHKKDRGANFSIMRMVEKLDLTDDQAQQIEQMMAEQSANRESASQSKAEVRELIEQGYADQAAEQAANVARDRVYKMVEIKQRLSEILTPEQLEQVEQLKERKKERKQRFKDAKASRTDG